MKILIFTLLMFVPFAQANEYYGSYETKVRPMQCMFGNICHANEYRKKIVYLERHKIKFLSYTYINDNLYATFYDYDLNTSFRQKACYSVANKMGQSYNVIFDPHKMEYSIYCNNFK